MPVVHSEFGPHLMLDCKGCDYDLISNLAYVFDFLNALPERIGMTKITQPYVFPYSGLVPEDKGITGVVVIAESHITFHSFIEKDYFFFDLFSCKDFDVDRVVQEVVKAFGVKEYEKHQANRGRYFPREADPADLPPVNCSENFTFEVAPLHAQAVGSDLEHLLHEHDKHEAKAASRVPAGVA